MIKYSLILLLSGCASINLVAVHRPLNLDNPCNFEKFTEHEKTSMIKMVGQKIARNQENCRITQRMNDDILKEHNKEHDNDL